MEAFIETRTGIDFWPLSPRPADVCITDIAHALSHQCRFSGHTREHYSVAEHSVRVSELLEAWGCNRETQLWGLLHDASEAYLVDLPSPLKRHPHFAPYLVAEARLMEVICDRFGLPRKQPEMVTKADGWLLATEARDLMPYAPDHWSKLKYPALATKILPWGSEAARAFFIERFALLRGKDRTDSPDTISSPAPDIAPESEPLTLSPTGDEQ